MLLFRQVYIAAIGKQKINQINNSLDTEIKAELHSFHAKVKSLNKRRIVYICC